MLEWNVTRGTHNESCGEECVGAHRTDSILHPLNAEQLFSRGVAPQYPNGQSLCVPQVTPEL